MKAKSLCYSIQMLFLSLTLAACGGGDSGGENPSKIPAAPSTYKDLTDYANSKGLASVVSALNLADYNLTVAQALSSVGVSSPIELFNGAAQLYTSPVGSCRYLGGVNYNSTCSSLLQGNYLAANITIKGLSGSSSAAGSYSSKEAGIAEGSTGAVSYYAAKSPVQYSPVFYSGPSVSGISPYSFDEVNYKYYQIPFVIAFRGIQRDASGNALYEALAWLKGVRYVAVNRTTGGVTLTCSLSTFANFNGADWGSSSGSLGSNIKPFVVESTAYSGGVASQSGARFLSASGEVYSAGYPRSTVSQDYDAVYQILGDPDCSSLPH
jgi:hypothetical protein